MSTQLNLDNNNPLSGVASSAKPDERYLVMLNGEAQIWDADRYNRNAQQLYADHAEDALAFKLDDGDGDLKAVLRQQLSAMEGVKDRYREAITGAQTYKDLLSIPGLAESQYLVTLGDEQQVWDAGRLQRNGDRLMSDHPEAQIAQLSYRDYWYDKAMQDDEAIKASKAEIDALKAEFAKQQRWSPEANALERQIIERQSALDALQAGYDANPRVVEAKAKYDAEYAAALEEYKKNYLPNLRSQIIQWQNEDVDMLAASKGAARKKLSGSPMMAGDPMGVMQAIDMLKGEDPATAFEANTMNEQYLSAQAFLAKAERLRESHSSFGEGIANVAMNQLEAWGSQSDMEAYSEIYGILKRLEDKLGNLDDISEEELTQNLSKSEQALILAFFEYNAAQADVQDSTGWAYKAGQIAGEAVPFILEFIATGGLTKTATKGATKGLSKALTSWIKNATKGSFRRTARKVVAKGVRGAAQGLTQAAMITPLRPTAYTNVTKAMTQIGKDGKLKDSGSDIAIAIADEYIETLSELSGGAITSVLGGLAKGTAKKFLSKNMYDTFATWGKRLANASGVKLLKSAQFHGLPVEIAEEYFGNTLRELYDAKALDKMHEDGNFAAMLLGFAPLTVLGAGVGMGQYVNAKNKVNKGAARLAGILAKDGFDKDQIDALIALEKELSPYSLAEKLDPVLTSMTKAGASKESRDAVIRYAMDVVRFKTLEGTVNAQESKKRQEKLDELTGKLGTFYQTKNEGTEWQENTVTQATLYDGRTVFLASAKNEMGEFAAVDAETGETLPVSESDIAMVENAETGESSLAVESQSLDTYLTSLVMSERKTAEEMRMADERATQIAALQERLKADAKLNIGTSDAPVYLAYLPEQSNADMAHFTMPDGTDTVLTWDQVGDYLNQPIRVFTDAQLADAEAAELENEEARLRAENAETNEDMDKVEEAVEDAEELEEEANPVHIPMNPDGTVNTDLFWDQNPEEWVKWNDQQRQDNGVDSMAQIAAGLQTAEAKLAEASKLPFATPTQREARDKEMGFWQDKINRYNALLEQYQLAAAAQEAQMARAYAAERLEAAEAALADKMKQAPKRSDYRFTPQYMQAKQKYDAEVAALQEEVTRWQNELAQYGEMPVQQEEVVPEENVPVAEEQQPEEVAPTAEELAAQLDAMLMSGASRSDEAVVAAMQAYADAIASGAPAKVVTRKNVMQVLKDAGVSETKMAEVKDALRRIQYIVNGFEANGVAYILADSVIISDNLRSTYVHERQHVMTALSGIDAALMTMTSREELQSAIAKMVGSDFYNGKGHKVLADELISMAMERAYRGENLDELFERIGLRNENAINFIKSIDDAQRNDSGLSLARVAEIGGNAAEGGSGQDGRTSLSGSTEMGEQGSRFVGRGGETAGDNTSGRGVGFSVSPNEGVAAMIENENGDAIAETNGGGDVRFSVLTYEQGGRDYLVNWLRKSKYMSKEERDFIIATLDQQYELAKRLGEEFPAFGAWSSAEVNVDKDGNPVMSVIKANGDYSMNLDFSLICKKRRPLNALLDVMIADRMLDMRSLNEAEIAKINKVIQRHGFEVACALCFVDSKRYRVVKVATDFADLYNELVESLIPEGSGIEAVESNYAGYEYINERNAEKTGRRLETVPDAELNWAKVDEILEGVKTPKSVEEKVAWMLRNNPSQRKLVNATDFVTNLGFESVKKNNPELLKVYNAKKGTGGPKASFGDVQYLNDILKSRSFTPARAYSVGGVRVQSFSDYMGHMFFDYMQMVAELAAKGLPAHAYTKEEAFARIFGMTGMKINMSLVPAVADDGVAPGLDAQGNYVWAVPYTDENGNEIQGQTFPPEVAFELQRDQRYSKNVGIIAVGVSDEHILKMLNDDEIHFIIPYHKSSLNPEVAKMTKIDKYADYTNVQNTRLGWEYANLDKEQKKAELKKRAFDFYKSLAKTKDPKATAAEYLEHCRQNGLIPKYDQFSGHENYYKLLVDFNTYDFNTGEYAPQGPVTMTFPEELESLVRDSVASNEELESDLKDKVGKMAEDVKEELGGTRFSARTDEQRQALFDSAKAEYGVTDNFNIAGYMLPDGSLLNFADKDGEPDVRGIDHRNIGSIINDREYGSRWGYVTDFVNEGAIRIMPESNAVHLGTAPSAEQREKLLDYFYKNNGYMILELTDENGNNVGYMEYDEGTSPYRIMRDIDGYFNDGIVPQQDIRFSVANESQAIFVSNAAKAVEGIKMEKATPEQWLKMIEKAGGLKAGEDKWMGLSDWLMASDKKTLTKQEVLDFIGEHMIQIEEVHYEQDAEDNVAELHYEIGDILQKKFIEYKQEFREANEGIDEYGDPAAEYAYQKLREEMDDTEGDIDKIGGYSVYVTFGYEDDAKMREWSEKLGLKYDPKAQISNIRLGYTTDGLENRREIALTVPTIESWNESDITHFGDAGDGRAVAWIRFGDASLTEVVNNDYQPKDDVEREIKDYIEYAMRLGDDLNTSIGYAYNQITDAPSEAVGWTEEAVDNVAKGMRGEVVEKARVLVIDEIQSQRHQEGREKGYFSSRIKEEMRKTAEDAKKAFSDYESVLKEKYGEEFVSAQTDDEIMQVVTREEYLQYDRLRDAYYDARLDYSNPRYNAVPDAPFEKNWHELAMKRMLRYAAENGYDYIAWTKGAQQAERYNIGEVVNEITRLTSSSGKRTFEIEVKDGSLYDMSVNEDGVIDHTDVIFEDTIGKHLSEVFGKEIADKMMAMHEKEKLNDLRIGGEGMRGFYDKMLPAFMNKYGKKWGVKVSDIWLPELDDRGLSMHSVPVTEEMKASVMEGQVMFSIGNNPQTDAMNAKQLKVPGGMLTDEQMGVADIRFSITKNNRATIEKWLRMRKDLNPAEKRAFWMYIEDKAPAMQMAIGRWFAKGAIRLPEDLTAVEDAFKFAQKMRVNAMDYETPAAIIKDYADRFGKGKEKDKEKRELLSPDDERFNGILTNKVDYGNGIVVYDVQNDMVGQKAVRELINDHLGTGVNIWCLLYANAEGEPTEGAEKMWWHYNSTQKKVMFYNGEIAAFCASDKKDSEWWDLHDKSHGTRIPVQLPVEGDRLGRSSICEFDGKKILPPAKGERYFRGNKKKGRYEEWANKDASSIVLRTIRKGGKDDGLVEEWDGKGNLIHKGNYKASEAIGHHVYYTSNGQVIRDDTYDQNGKHDGFSRLYEEDGNPISVRQYVHGRPEGEWLEYENGKLKSTFTYENGILAGYQIEYDKKGKVVSKKYHNTYKDGNYTMTVTHENGPEGKIVGVKRRLKHDSPVIESLEIEERPGGWFKKPETTIYVRKGGTSIWYSDKEGLLSYYSYDQKSNERRSIGMSSEGIQVSFWPSVAGFNRKGRLLSFDEMTDRKSLAENREEADRMWAFASDIMANAKDMAEGMENEILTKVQESEVRFSVVPHESTMDEVDSMFKQYNGDPFVRELYGKVSELAHTMGLKISFAEGMDRRSGLNVLDKIKYNVDYFNSPGVYAQDKAKTLLHELIHAVTRYAIYAKDAEFMNPRLKEAVSQLESIYDEIKNDPAFEDMYGATSVEEMVSELANVRFRAKLREKNLLQRIVDAIKDLLGIDKGTKALDNLSATLEDMIVNFDRAAYEQVRKDVSMQENYMRFSAALDPAVRAEMDVIKATAFIEGKLGLAPNGKKSNLDEDQWALVRTKNFKNWFGDWENDPENASKVVDENGEPMVVYHGTPWYGFSEFGAYNGYGYPIYFAEDETFAEEFTHKHDDELDSFDEDAMHYFNRGVYKVFLNARNPMDLGNLDEESLEHLKQVLGVSDEEIESYRDSSRWDKLYFLLDSSEELNRKIVESGYDSFFGYQDGSSWGNQWAVYNPSQIKSATDNTGEFSESEDIRFSAGDFGEIYEQFRGKPKEAIAFLMGKQSGEAVGALYHPEIGEIDLVWGEVGTGKSDGYGLAKLVKFHPEVIDNLQEILSEMQIVKQSANRVNLESDKYQAAVRLTWNNKAKKWLLTAFEKKNSALDNTTDTGETSNGSKQNDTATLQGTVSDSKGTNNFESASESGENIAFSVRTKPAPKEVKRAYKLFNVDGEGKPHALFIDGANALDEKVWYDADSPLIKDLENLESGYTYYVDKDGNAERKTYKNKKQSPSKEELADAAAKGGRYIYVGTYANGEKSYYNWGVNGGKNGGSVSQFAMRPGWHLTDSPSARHIGAGRNPQAKQEAMYRKPNQRWFEVEYAADVDYNEEAQANPTGDIQTHIPEDGYYSFKTNTAANDVNQNWIISGAIRIVKPLTREQVSKLNEENGVPDDLDYENGTMFSVSERPVDEIVNDGVQKVSEEGKKAKASLKQRMDDIDSKLYYVMRLVANAQKNYDKKTVDIMTNLAKELMRDGALSDPTRGEINRLLSAIKNATGKADLTAAATALMDVMVSNQLRHAKNTLAQMLKIKAKKVNASGVEVQGTLDLVGQRLIATVKESVGLTLEQIDDRIADAKEKMDSEFDTIKNNAAIDLVGLNIARKYVEGIVASEAEEKDLRKELESAQEDKKAGKMTTEALREFRKATEDAIRQNRMERTSAYRSILSEMAKLITESVTKAGQFRNAEKERVEKIHHYANSDMKGMDAAEHVNNDQRFTNNPILRFFLKPLGTMDQMLRQMGRKHVNGEGYLWNHFMRGWLEATEKEYLGVSAAHKALDAKAKEVFGVKRWSDIFSIVRSLPSMHVEFWDGGKMRDHVLTQGNLLYIYMVNKMSDGKMKLRRMGIEEEQVRQMSMFMDPRLIEVGEWLQNEFLPSLRDKYNVLHEKMFGAPMAAIDSYFPIKVLANARTREVDVATPEAEAKASTITGAIIKRTKNSLALDVLGSDALDVVLGHIQEMEHWAAFAEWNRDLNTLLSYKKFRNRVQNMSGLYGSGATAWKNFRDACEVAAGVYKPASSGDAIDRTALNLAKGVTAGKISFRVFTAIKQLLSMPAFVSDANMVELGKSIATPWESWNWAMKELPLFQKRWLSRQAGDSRLVATESDWKLWKTNFVEAASRYGMAPNAFVDALTVSIGAKAIYETKLAKYIENGYSVDAAEKKAKQDATILFNESQQSNEGAFLSAMQVDRSWISVALTVFRNSSMGYQRMLVDALRNIKHRMSKGYKDESIEFMAKQMVRDGLSESQAQRAAERMYNRGFWHSMMRVGTFGFLVQFAWNLGAYLPYLVLGADDDEKEKMLKDASTHALLGGFVEGLSAGSLISEASNLIASGEGLKDYDPNLMPVVSDIKRLVQLWGTDAVAAASETLNLIGQIAIGVNPQTFTDIGVAIYDACDGDPQIAREATLLLARILQVPQSQTEQIYIDEIDFTVDKALDLTIEEFAQRYARYKRMRSTVLTGWMYSDEEERKQEDRYIKRFTKRAEELKRTRGNETAKAWYDYVDNEYKEVDLTIRELRSGAEKAAKKEDRVSVEEFAAKMQELMQTPEFRRYQQRAGKVKAVERLRQAMKDYPTKRDTLEDRMLEIRKQLVEEMQLAE